MGRRRGPRARVRRGCGHPRDRGLVLGQSVNLRTQQRRPHRERVRIRLAVEIHHVGQQQPVASTVRGLDRRPEWILESMDGGHSTVGKSDPGQQRGQRHPLAGLEILAILARTPQELAHQFEGMTTAQIAAELQILDNESAAIALAKLSTAKRGAVLRQVDDKRAKILGRLANSYASKNREG